MDKSKVRGFINMLNMEAENLELDDIQVAQVPVEQIKFPDMEVAAEEAGQIYITISKKLPYASYPPTGTLVGFGITKNVPLRLAYERANAFLRGIKFARDIADTAPKTSDKISFNHLTSVLEKG